MTLSLSAHEKQELGVIEERLATSDPHLAAMLAAFSRLADGEAIPAREQLPADSQRSAAHGLLACQPARPGPRETTRRRRFTLPVVLVVWLVISSVLVTVAVLLSHTSAHENCTPWSATACAIDAPGHL